MSDQNFAKVYICAAVRSPLGSFGGSLATLSAPQIAAQVTKGALAQISPDDHESTGAGEAAPRNGGSCTSKRQGR